MSTGSEAVKAWRRRFRDRIRISLGGKCVCCGYDKCSYALEGHHVDPSGKDFTFGEVSGHPRAWDTMKDELKKCVLVCSNCHIKIHSGMRETPVGSSFSETEFARMAASMNAERNAGKFKKKNATV